MNIRTLTLASMLLLLASSLFAQTKSYPKPVVASIPPQSYLLQYRFQKGELLHYKSNSSMTMLSVKGEIQEKVVSKTKSKKHFKVVDVDKNSKIVLEPILDHVIISAQFNKSPPIAYDSSSKSNPPEKYKNVVDSIGTAMVRLKVDEQGTVHDMIPQRKKEGGHTITQTKVETEADKMNQMSQKNFLVKFPTKPVKIGDTWGEILHLNVSTPKSRLLKKPVQLKRKYELKSVKNNIATIALKTYLLTNIRNPHQKVQLIQRTPQGTILFDIKRGILISRKTKIDEKVFGVSGGDSFVHATSTFEETFVKKEN